MPRKPSLLALALLLVAGPSAPAAAPPAPKSNPRPKIEPLAVLGHPAWRQSEAISALRVRADGKTLVSVNSAGTVHFWDYPTGFQRLSVMGFEHGVQDLRFTKDETGLLLIGGNSVRLWELGGGKEITSVKESARLGEAAWPNALAVCPEGKVVAHQTKQGEHKVRLTSFASKKTLRDLVGHTAALQAAFSPDGKTLVTAAGDETIRLWDVAKRKELLALEGLSNQGKYAAFSPDGRLVATLGKDQGVGVWKTDDVRRKWDVPMKDFRTRPWGLAFGPDAKTLAVSRIDGEVWLHGVASHEGTKKFAASRNDIRALMEELAHEEDVGKAGEALRKLALRDQDSVRWLARLKLEVDAAQVRKLLTDLDNEEAATRDGAAEALEELSPGVGAALRDELKRDVSAQVRRSVKKVLGRLEELEKVEKTALLACRVVELLELLASPEADEVLRWAKAKPETELTRQAKEAVRRMARFPKNKY